MMIKKYVLAIFLGICLLTKQAAASDKIVITDPLVCYEHWQKIWHQVKSGDLKARYELMIHVSGIFGDQIVPPGESDNYISRISNTAILLIHSYSYYQKDLKIHIKKSRKKDNPPSLAPDLIDILNHIGFENTSGGEMFLQCIQNAQDGCDKFAEEKRLVPSFEEYEKKIDALMAQGLQPTCK